MRGDDGSGKGVFFRDWSLAEQRAQLVDEVERGAADLSWLSQSTGFAGSRQYAEQQRYDLIQLLPARIPGADGVTLDIDPDATHPQRDGGLFTV